MNLMIDTHKEYKLLLSKGFKEEQAEAITEIMSKKNDDLATKQDLKSTEMAFKHDLKAMELVLRQEIESSSHDLNQKIESSSHNLNQKIESVRHDLSQKIESVKQDQMWIKGLLLLVLGILIKNSFF